MNEIKGRARGGAARAAALTGEERSDIAAKAAAARWSLAHGKVTHEGVLILVGQEMPCYVTEDGTRLISGRKMQEVLKLVDEQAPPSGQKPGSRVDRLLNLKSLKPLFLQKGGADHFALVKTVHATSGKPVAGYRVELLADICEVMMDAKAQGLLTVPRQLLIAEQCYLLWRGFGRIGLAALVDEATGYQNVRARDALQQMLERYLRKELAVWVKRFPDEFYEQLYRLRGWEWRGMSVNRISACATYTNDLIYARIAPGLLEEMKNRNPVQETGRRKGSHHQFLTDEIGIPKLAQHFGSVLAYQRISRSWDEFMRYMDTYHARQGNTLQLDFGL